MTNTTTCFPFCISNAMHDLTWTIMPKKFNVMSSFLSTSLLILSFRPPSFKKGIKTQPFPQLRKLPGLFGAPFFSDRSHRVRQGTHRNQSRFERGTSCVLVQCATTAPPPTPTLAGCISQFKCHDSKKCRLTRCNKM